MTYNKANNLIGWLCGLVAAAVYIATADRFNSWWDTGEFIASAYKLQVVHQPGAPMFLLIQNLFSNLAMGDVSKVAFWMNVGSAVCSGLTIVFLFWTITALSKKVLLSSGKEPTGMASFQILGAGAVGALAYSFTDSFWYSAVESEVYAMSSLCTAIVFWLILKWESRVGQEDANKWLLVIAFVIGLSIGVHLLNLLTIPVLALIVYFKKAKQVNWLGTLKTISMGIALLAFVLWGVIQYSVKIAAYTDLFFVNSLGLGFGSGIIFFVLCLLGGLIFGIIYAKKKAKPILQLSLLAVCFVFFGFSSYAMLLIRSQTNISLNNGSPDNAFSFLGYLSREQYQSEPLFKGPSFDAHVVGVEKSHSYWKGDGKYRQVASSSSYKYDKEMLFPRLYSDKHADIYSYYLGLDKGVAPSFGDNLKFFFSYQLNHMYLRYFMWNFVGRQNDEQGHGGDISGNWLSGITPIDNMFLAGQSDLSDAMKADPSRNVYFFAPFILGIMGLLWHIKRSRRDALVVALLFFFTGIAIVLYLNQTPMQPRERDYAYAGSFYMFSVWIGLGVLALTDLLKRYLSIKGAAITAFSLATLAVPVLLVSENWDDHNRSDREWTRDMAYNYLQSCEENAILFTYADNDTFPLWYLQEVEGVRPDVRIVNLSYLQSDWYVKQSMKGINRAEAAPIQIDTKKIDKGIRDVMYVHDMGIEGHVDVDTLLDIMLSDNPNNQLPLQNGEFANFLPTKKLRLKIDREAVIRNKVVPKSWEEAIPEAMQWTYKKEYVSRAELAMMAILANNKWERPIYFANMLSSDNFMGLDRYLVNEGLVYRLMPIEAQQPDNQMSLVNTDTLFKNITENFRWGNIAQMKHFDQDYRSFANRYLFGETVRLALDTLIQEGNMKQGKEVALLAYEKMPEKIVNMEHLYDNAVVVDTLFKVEEQERASILANNSLKYLDEQLRYYQSVGDKLSTFDIRNMRLAVESLESFKQVVHNAKNADLIARVSGIEKRYKEL